MTTELEPTKEMPGSARKPRPATAILKEARSFLKSSTNEKNARSVVSSSDKELNENSSGRTNQNAKAGGDLLLRCTSLLEDFHKLTETEFNFEFKDWTVVKAVMELLVRWGIYPYLSPGVGTPIHKRFGEKAAASAAAAVSDHLLQDASAVDESEPACVDIIDGVFETHPLILSAELLSSLALKKSAGENSGTRAGTADDCGHYNANVKEEQDKRHDSNSSEEENNPGSSSPAMQQLVLSHHLVDVLAALLQAAYGPSLPSTSRQAPETWKKNAAERIKVMVERLPVAHLVEALFILLGEAEGSRVPLWLKPVVGRLLSLVVIRDGGVAAVMERLVGSAAKGSVHVYEKVAAQLARVPRSVASKDQYYKAVCMQLQPLLVLPSSHSKFGSSSHIAFQLLNNIHHTSILLACTLANQDPVLVERYLSQPIVEPLLCWGAQQHQSQIRSTRSVQDKVCNGLPEKGAIEITERSVMNSLLQVQTLLTAGHEGCLYLRQQLLKLTSPLASGLMSLSYLLWPLHAKHDGDGFMRKVSRVSIGQGETHDGRENCGRQTEEQGGPHKDFTRGFLIGRNLSTPSGTKGEVVEPVGQFVDAIADVVHSHLSATVTQAMPIVWDFLSYHETTSFKWPRVDGEIAHALKAGREQLDSAAVFLSKLLLRSENWELVLSLLSMMLENVLKLRKTTMRRSSQPSADDVAPEAVLQLLQTLDIICVEVGFKAVEQDAAGALPLLKALLDDNGLVEDMEILDLVLPLVHGALSKLQRENLYEDGEKTQLLNKNQQGIVLSGLGTSLEKVRQSAGVTTKQKQFAAELMSMICMKDSATRT